MELSYIMSATVIIPTTGHKLVIKAVQSVLNQSYPTSVYLVVDGNEFYDNTVQYLREAGLYNHPNISLCLLPDNVGKNNFYGHRIYGAFSFLVNSDYVLFLDQDCWFESHHVKTCIDIIEKEELDWSYSLRNIYSKEGEYICKDIIESFGANLYPKIGDKAHIDTNCYCLKVNVAYQISSYWYGKHGQDRKVLKALVKNFPNYKSTRCYTLNYRLGGNDQSVSKEFFTVNSRFVLDYFNGKVPWENDLVN